MLRPGGLFVFVEPDKIPFSSGGGTGSSDGDVIELVKRVFPEDIKVKSMSSSNIKKSGVDSTIPISNSFGGSNSDSSKKDSSKKSKKSSSTYKSRQTALVSDFVSSIATTTTDEVDASANIISDSNKTISDEGAFIISSPITESDSIPVTTESDDSSSTKTSDSRSSSNGAVLKPSSTWSSSASTKNSKPGLVFEVHNNILDTYVTGIAVRSY